ncbi:MAG TPA: class I SAM-dependent methyltransferase [Planctomycetota bacterium]|nr:class I SAM-dependent methyltransferase [Planctomycetota bacterium]
MSLHDQQPETRFSKRAQAYAESRPDYPPEVYEALLEGFDRSVIVVADVGAGTGIASRGLAARGVRVIALDPNAEMRNAARPHPLVELREGSGESTGLAEASVDIVAAFQAFHWFDAPRALVELHRVLKPGGRAGLVWNLRDHTDAFTNAYTEVIQRFATLPAAEERPGVADPLMTSGLFRDVQRFTYSHFQRLTTEGLLGRAKSTSYLPSEGDSWDALRAELRLLHAARADDEGLVRLQYRTDLHRAGRA